MEERIARQRCIGYHWMGMTRPILTAVFENEWPDGTTNWCLSWKDENNITLISPHLAEKPRIDIPSTTSEEQP
jgi:hypothetical protein